MARQDFEIGGQTVAPGTARTVELPVSVMSDHTPATLTVHVVHGKREGPTLFVSAAVHGDEGGLRPGGPRDGGPREGGPREGGPLGVSSTSSSSSSEVSGGGMPPQGLRPPIKLIQKQGEIPISLQPLP